MSSLRSLTLKWWALITTRRRVPRANPGESAASITARRVAAVVSLALHLERGHVDVAAALGDDAPAQALDGAAHLGPVAADDEIDGLAEGRVRSRWPKDSTRAGSYAAPENDAHRVATPIPD